VYGRNGRVSEAVGVVCDASVQWNEDFHLLTESEESPRRGDGKIVEKSPIGLSNL
jgi:hypothetical protein